LVEAELLGNRIVETRALLAKRVVEVRGRDRETLTTAAAAKGSQV